MSYAQGMNPGVFTNLQLLYYTNEFFQNGLYTTSENEDGTYNITKTKITHNQLTQVITNLLHLNHEGFDSKEAATKRERDGQ